MSSNNTTLLQDTFLDGQKVSQLYPGWEAKSRNDLVAGFSVVLFVEEATGRNACWWLLDNHYCGSHILALTPEHYQTLLPALEPLFRPFTDGVLGSSAVQTPPPFPSIPTFALRELSAAWLNYIEESPLLIKSGHADSGEALTCPSGQVIAENRLTTLLQARPSQNATVLTSPFSGMPLRAQITMDLHGHLAYRFYDQEDDFVFYLIWAKGTSSERPSFYFPKGRLLISDSPVGALLPDWILTWFIQNPEHAAAIQDARPFKPEDFGVGRASTVRIHTPEKDASAPPSADSQPRNTTARSQPKRSGLISYLPSLILPPKPQKLSRYVRVFSNV
ncbi:hypothetical protein D5366_03265 [Neokomagataea tanensis]|uniref:Uncharacterized protein n=1 Tax=Neokomagataea tanensis TaxID=661191 RepID=A0A4Y6V6Y1_9PROT|nr:hypothetical protein [Neokomagataea tanensis]QDH24420.1 hypothetical protein D5366_03265 [Neokomagataea tanensis]